MNRSSSVHCFLQTPSDIHHHRPQAEDILSDEDLLDVFRIIKQIIRKKPDCEQIAKLYFCIVYAMGDLYQFYKPIHSDVLVFRDESNVSAGPVFAEVQLPVSATCCQNVPPEDPLLTPNATRAITASPAQAAAVTPTMPNGTISNSSSTSTKWNNYHHHHHHHHHPSSAPASSMSAGGPIPPHSNLPAQASSSVSHTTAAAVPQRILSVSYLTNPSPQHKASPQVASSQLLSRGHRESAAQAAAAAALATPTATPVPSTVDADEITTDQYSIRPYTNLRSAYAVQYHPQASSVWPSSSSTTPIEDEGSSPQPTRASTIPHASPQQQQQQHHSMYHQHQQHSHHLPSSTSSTYQQSQQQQQQTALSSQAHTQQQPGFSASPGAVGPSTPAPHLLHHASPLATPSSDSSSMMFGPTTMVSNSNTTTASSSRTTTIAGTSVSSSGASTASSSHMSLAASAPQHPSVISNSSSNTSTVTQSSSYTTLSRYPHLNTLIHGNGTNTEVLMEPKQRGFYYQDGRITREPALLQRYAEQGVLTQASLMRKRKKIFGQLEQDYPSSYVEALSIPAPAKKPKIPHRHGEFRQRRDDIISRMRTIMISDLEQKAQRLPESFTLSIEKATLPPNIDYTNLGSEEAGKLLAPALRILCYHSNMKPHLDNGMNQNGIYYNNDYFRLYLAFVQFQEIFATLFPNEVVRITSFLDDLINNNNNNNNNASSPSADNQSSSNSSQVERDKDRERNANMKAYRGWIEPFLTETNWAAFRRNIMVGERIMQLTKVVGQGVLLMTKELSGSKLHLTFTNNEWEEFIQGLSQGLWDDTIDWSHDDDGIIYNDDQHAYRNKKSNINGGSLLVNELKMKFATHFWFTEDGKLVPPAERKRLRALERQQNSNNSSSNSSNSSNNNSHSNSSNSSISNNSSNNSSNSNSSSNNTNSPHNTSTANSNASNSFNSSNQTQLGSPDMAETNEP